MPAAISDERIIDELAERYYIEGFFTGRFRQAPAHQRLLAVLRHLRDGELRAGFTWQTKYARSRDLKPEAIHYDPALLEILEENGIPELLSSATGLELRLAHVQIRLAERGSSYMWWHRDTYLYRGRAQPVGHVPPVHKLIFYPSLGLPSSPRLNVLPGSQRRMFRSRCLDRMQALLLPTTTIASSDDAFILFDTSILHAAVRERDEQGLRLIYSFCRASQLESYQRASPDRAA